MRTPHQQGSSGGPGVAGREEMDGEHHIQLGLLYALREAVRAGEDDNVQDVLDRLVDYSKMHFASEQLLMRLYQYGEYDGHAGEHEQMIQCLEELRAEQAAAGCGGLRADALDALDADLIGHIRNADRALGRYLAGLPRHPERLA
ncbi:MAG: hemerythrin domain-containing protein [Rhodospirillales bacterium]|nr:hemerythrin domain-containing protein [Rhodospirillales bacterium]